MNDEKVTAAVANFSFRVFARRVRVACNAVRHLLTKYLSEANHPIRKNREDIHDYLDTLRYSTVTVARFGGVTFTFHITLYSIFVRK